MTANEWLACLAACLICAGMLGAIYNPFGRSVDKTGAETKIDEVYIAQRIEETLPLLTESDVERLSQLFLALISEV